MIYIIMCTYNGEKYIEEQLESIAQNTVKDWKLFIQDDCSTDTTVEKIKEFQNRYPQQVCVSINEKAQGAIRNFLSLAYWVGCQMNENDYLMFCDQDDVWNSKKIELTLQRMQKLVSNYGNEIPLLVCSDVEVVDESLNVIAKSFRKSNHYKITNMDFSHLIMENKVQGCTMMINKVIASKLEQLPKCACMHDGWVGLIAASMGKIAYIDQPTMKYRQHSRNVMGSIDFWADMRGKLGNLSAQKNIVYDTIPQVKEFLEIYEKEMDEKSTLTARKFCLLPEKRFWVRRYYIIKYHMWKSGILRNMGLLLLI